MTADVAADLARAAILIALTISGPALISMLLTGLLMSLLQTLMQLQDQTLSFIPKLVALSLVLTFLLPWGLSRLTEYAADLIRGIPGTI